MLRSMRFAVLGILGIVSVAALSPSAEGAEVTFGFRAGYASGQLRAKEGDEGYEVGKHARGGVNIGLMANIRLTSFLALQPEVLFLQKGGAYDVGVPVGLPGVTVDVSDSRALKYIEVPLLLKLVVPLRGKFRPTFLLGPSFALNLGGELESRIAVGVGGLRFKFIETKDLKRELNDLEVSLVFGGGFDIDLGKGTLVFDDRFYFGLEPNRFKVTVPTSKFAELGFPAGPDFSYDLDMNNYVLTVSVGYLF